MHSAAAWVRKVCVRGGVLAPELAHRRRRLGADARQPGGDLSVQRQQPFERVRGVPVGGVLAGSGAGRVVRGLGGEVPLDIARLKSLALGRPQQDRSLDRLHPRQATASAASAWAARSSAVATFQDSPIRPMWFSTSTRPETSSIRDSMMRRMQ